MSEGTVRKGLREEEIALFMPPKAKKTTTKAKKTTTKAKRTTTKAKKKR